jgi:hypothetical protein
VTESFLFKGSFENLSWSIVDMKRRVSKALHGMPDNWMIWGVNERFKWVLKRLEEDEVFVYVTKGPSIDGGLALYGVAMGVATLSEKYWPKGEGWAAFYLEVKGAAPGVLEYPEDPKQWKLVPKEKLREAGIPLLPGPQKLKQERAEALKKTLKSLTQK